VQHSIGVFFCISARSILQDRIVRHYRPCWLIWVMEKIYPPHPRVLQAPQWTRTVRPL